MSMSILLIFKISQEGDDKTFNLDWERVRIFDKEVAQMFVGMIKSSDSARYEEKQSFKAFYSS